MFHVKHDLPTLLAVAGGRRPRLSWLQEAAAARPLYCADKGCVYALEAQLKPKAVFGDGDSGGLEAFQRAQALGAQIFTFPVAKDATDLQLLLEALPEGDLLLSGCWGGRFDHLFSLCFSLLGWKQQRKALAIMADELEQAVLLGPGERVDLRWQQLPQAVSLLPLTETATVSLAGAQWPLNKQQLKMNYPYAISNRWLGKEPLSCTCHSGYVALYSCKSDL